MKIKIINVLLFMFAKAKVSILALVALCAFSFVPYKASAVAGPSFSSDMRGFILSTSGNPGDGSFGNGNVGAYPEGGCVPVSIEVTNDEDFMTNIDLSVIYDYHHSGNSTDVVGIERLEGISLNYVGAPSTADNLSDFNFSNDFFSNVLSFESTTGTIYASVSEARGGKNGNSGTADNDKERHHDITLQSVPAGATVYVLFCGRLGVDAGLFPGSSMHIDNSSGGGQVPIDSKELLLLPSLTIVKEVADGTATPDQWSFNVSPDINGQSSYSIPTDEATTTIDNIDTDGIYTITEGAGPTEYSFAYGNGTNCTFDGSTATACTFTNSINPIPMPTTTGTLMIVKNVVNDNEGTSVASDFELTLDSFDGNTTTTQTFDGDASGTEIVIEAGTYSVSEGAYKGYTAGFSADCSGTLAAGETKTCTVTNDDDYVPPPQAATGTIILVKNVINNYEGTSLASDFTLNLNLTTSSTTSTIDVVGNASGTAVVVEVGEFNVTEAAYDGYTASFDETCSGYLNERDVITCTVTNNDDYVAPPETPTGTLIVIKRVVNREGGELIAEDFTMTIDLTTSSTEASISFAGNSSGTTNVLEVGSYSVSEDGYEGYEADYSEDCSGYLAEGEVKTCTITNTYNSGEPQYYTATLIVVKQVINNSGMHDEPSDFVITAGYTTLNMTTATTSFPGDASGTHLTVGPGEYWVQEENYDNYETTYSEGCSGTIAAGQTITCTIVNDDGTAGGGGGGGTAKTAPEPSSGGGGISAEALNNQINNGPTPRVLAVEDTGAQCVLTEVEALYVSSIVNEMLAHLGLERNVTLEEYFNAILTPRVVPVDLDSVLLAAVQNFVNYGTKSNVRLGQGERAGVVDSFRAVYGRVPLDECDWQNAIKIGNTTLPLNLNTDREQQMNQTFKKIYGREANRSDAKDDIAVNIMAYGIRPQIRDLKAEALAIDVFEHIFGKKPSNATEWDANRAIAYSGIAHSLLKKDLTNAASRMMSIRIHNEPIR